MRPEESRTDAARHGPEADVHRDDQPTGGATLTDSPLGDRFPHGWAPERESEERNVGVDD